MGDMAIGKLIDGVLIEPVMAADFDQFVADVDNHQEWQKAAADSPEMMALAPPAAPALLDTLATLVVPGTPSELVLCLMQWHSGGFFLFDYAIASAEQIINESQPDHMIIGRDMDDELLIVHTADGAMQVGDALAGEDVSQFLGRFRFELCAQRLEWAEPWVSKA